MLIKLIEILKVFATISFSSNDHAYPSPNSCTEIRSGERLRILRSVSGTISFGGI